MDYLVNKKGYCKKYIPDYLELINKLEFDSYTYTHSINVATYAAHFTKHTGNELDANQVFFAGLFHDIGKTDIDIDLLNKKELLSESEFATIRTHSTLGFNILSKYRVPDEVLYAAQFHHERNDGSGYPFGLKGEQIPLVTRIISICDVFEALTADRPYREAYTVEQALLIINDMRYSFDPDLLSVFISNIYSICPIARQQLDKKEV